MSPRLFGPSRGRIVGLFGLLLLWQVWWLLLTPYGLASTWTHDDDLRVVSAGGAGVSQDILMGADGFDGVWVRAAPSHAGGRPLAGQVLITLAHVVDGRPSPVERQVMDAAALGTGRPVHLRFAPIRSSRGERFRLALTHAASDDAGVLHVLARRSDAHPHARFLVDGREQWGDLLFETSARRATLPYWKHEVLGAWPAWMQSWWTIALVILGFNLLLVRACAMAVTPMTAEDAGSNLTDGQGSSAARRLAMLAASLVVAIGLVVVVLPAEPLRVIRLTQHMSDAEIRVSGDSLHDSVAVQPEVILARAYPSIVALPTSRLAWAVDVPKGALLVGHAAMRPEVWTKEGDGANLVVSIVDASGTRTEVARYTLVPFIVDSHRNLHPLRVSLDPWAGQTVTLVLETDPERWGNAVNDVPLWVDPRIEWPRGAAWGEARIRRR